MSCPLFPAAYDKLIEEDIKWLEANTPDCIERHHVTIVLKHSASQYRERGYDESMRRDTAWNTRAQLSTQSPADGANSESDPM